MLNRFLYYQNRHTIYNIYDSVHSIKNIRNKLVNSKRFVFPSVKFNEFEDNIYVDAGEISWHLLRNVHEKDEKLPSNLKSLQTFPENITSR